MTAGMEMYDSSGTLILTDNSKILKVDEFRTTKSTSNGIWANYYYSGTEESSKTVLVRPQVIGEEMLASTVYSKAIPYVEVQTYLPGTYTVTNKVEVAICSVTDTASPSAKYFTVYDDAGNLSFDLNTFIKGARVIHSSIVPTLLNNTWQTITLPSGINMNNMFVLLPYSHIFNADNGTDSVYSGSYFRFRFTSDNKFQYKIEAWKNSATSFNVLNVPITLLEVVR